MADDPSDYDETGYPKKFRPMDEISKEMRRRREENGRKLREAAPRLKAWLESLNEPPEDE